MKGSHLGAYSSLTKHFSFNYENQDVDRIRKMINSGEGCRVAGYVKVNKVPGNVHLSTYSHSYLFGSLYQETRNINISHHVNHISFGTDTDISYVKKNFKDTGIVSPLDGVEQIVGERKPPPPGAIQPYGLMMGGGATSGGVETAIFEYYTKVVPTTYRPLDSPEVR